MYAWIWRRLPGPWPVKTPVALVLLAAVLGFLFGFAFPTVEAHFDNVLVPDEPVARP